MDAWNLYCEESSKESRYLVLGGILIRRDSVDALNSRIDSWRSKEKISGEVSWKKTTLRSLDRHKQFVMGTVGHASAGNLAFRCAVFDSDDHRLFPGVHGVDRYEKRLYQFLLHLFIRGLPVGDRLYVYPDHQFMPRRPEVMAERLNHWLTGRGMQNVIAQIEPLDSVDSHFIQMSDLLSGAVGGANNKNYDPASNRGIPKEALINYVSEMTGGLDLTRSTPYGKRDFKIWHFVPEKKKDALSPIASAMNLDMAKDFGTQ